jgi:hypothetical protein
MDQELREKLFLDRVKEIQDDLTPFGFIETGLEAETIVDSSGQMWEVVN